MILRNFPGLNIRPAYKDSRGHLNRTYVVAFEHVFPEEF